MTGFDDGLAVRWDEPLRRHSAWRTGGPCDCMVWVHRAEALPGVMDDCRSAGWKVTPMGSGHRAIIREGGVRGCVLRLGTDFGQLRVLEEGVWEVGAAVPVPALVAATTAAGFTGLEPMANRPGTVGASLLLDDGWDDAVEGVHHLHRGRFREDELDEVQGRKRLITGVRIRLVPGDPKQISRALNLALDARRRLPPGSWYSKPKRGALRDLLGSVELPRVRLRKVTIPGAAPELLVNLGTGTASDFALLHKSATERVRRTRGVELESRMRWIGARLAEDAVTETTVDWRGHGVS